VLTEPPTKTLARNGGAPLPLLIGSNAREIDAFGGEARAQAAIDQNYGTQAAAAHAFYASLPATDPRRGDKALQIATDMAFACPAGVVAAARAKAGHPTWQYEFDYALPNQQVSHSSEIRFAMGDPATFPTGEPPLQSYWINFARTGDPNGPGLPRWEPYGTAKRYISFEDGRSTMKTDLRGGVCRLRAAP
jgi:carboxylesterase type B